ncbi:MAG: SgcJ/EcaC family oxidoreductase [Gammaproteobacteria bacterium]
MQTTDQNAPRENMDRWIAALQSGAPGAVAQLYDAAATFLPTASAQFLRGRAGAEAYFAGFLQTHQFGAVTEECAQWLGAHTYAHSGMYDFIRTDGGKRAPARFTFIWRRDTEHWRILHHHSSLQPGGA